nr:hypothetical protein [Zoogloea sp.]
MSAASPSSAWPERFTTPASSVWPSSPGGRAAMCWFALLLAPFLRKFGQFTLPDFLGARYEGHFARVVGVFAGVLASFVYVVAQIYGVGLITSRFIGIEFEIGVFVGLAGILVCSFLGGMRAVTWTQVAIPHPHHRLPGTGGHPLPTRSRVFLSPGRVWRGVAGSGVKELDSFSEPRENEVRLQYRYRADEYARKIRRPARRLVAERIGQVERVTELRTQGAPAREIAAAERTLRDLPRTPDEARIKWERARQDSLSCPSIRPPRRSPPGTDQAAKDSARNNFLALTFVLMVGTAALPHILMRYYTTPSVREARRSVFWSLFFIFLLYVTAPPTRYSPSGELSSNLIGTDIGSLPGWVASWARSGWSRSRTSTATASCNWPNSPSTATPSCSSSPRSPACPTWCRAWWRRGGWRRPCPPPTACC